MGRYFLVFLWSIALVGLLVLTSIARAAEMNYVLTRAVEWVDWVEQDNAELFDAEGFAVITDDGPYTPIVHVVVDVSSCVDVQFSPAPNCEPYELLVDEFVTSHVGNGKVYRLENGEWLTIIRRGSVETGDPSLILFVDGIVLIFAEQSDD